MARVCAAAEDKKVWCICSALSPRRQESNIAQKIVEQQADYVLTLKENHPTLYDDVKLWLDTNDTEGYVHVDEKIEKDHGRIEIRRVAVSTKLDWLEQKTEWVGLKAVAQTIRDHWAIENRQHWITRCAVWRRRPPHP